MAARLTTFSKLLITALIVGGIGFLIIQLSHNQQGVGGDDEVVKKDENKGFFNKKKEDGVDVAIFTWGGYAPGLYFNEGLSSSASSRYMTDYNLPVNFILIDDFDANRQAWKSGDVDIIGTTADALPTEMAGLAEYEPQIIFQVDWSRGGDAIIAKRGINSINDLKGKKVAVTPSTPSQTFLLWMLEAANLSLSDIEILEVPSAIDAANAFKSDNNVDAAVVWSPDDEISTRAVPGSKVLQSTRNASHIIADVFIAQKSWVDANRDKVDKFYEGWMRGAAEINSSAGNYNKAAETFANAVNLSPEDGAATIANVHLCTHGDNLNFFGRNVDYRGVTGEQLYTKMAKVYSDLGFAPANTPSWRMLAYGGAMSNAALEGDEHAGEGQAKFEPATSEEKSAPAIASKPVSISFATGEYALGENAKTLIDLQFAEIAKAFGNSRVRIEGNTDNTGGRDLNVRLSKQRAESVAKYLEGQYGMDRNRFVIVGNGPDKPVIGCETNGTDDCRAKNRRTEFQLIPG